MAAESLRQFEKNVSISFGYVKKDLIMINDSISDLHEKIQHLSLNNAGLMGKIAELENRMAKKSPAKTSKRVAPKAKASKKTKKKVIKETTLYE